MNEQAAKVLNEITQIDSCRFRVYVSTENYTSLAMRDSKSEKKIVLQVDIVIYGGEDNKLIVGQHLSNSKIYLQHPCYQDPDTRYDNPHVLAITDLLASSSLATSTTPSTTQTPVKDAENILWNADASLDDTTESQDVLERQMGKVFESLTRFKSLKRLEADIRVTTQLLPSVSSHSQSIPLADTLKSSTRSFRLHVSTRVRPCSRTVFPLDNYRKVWANLVCSRKPSPSNRN